MPTELRLGDPGAFYGRNHIPSPEGPTRNARAAKRFLERALTGLKDWEQPEIINTHKTPTYGTAISELKAEGRCSEKTAHRQVKYLNNVVEGDYGKLKQLVRPVRGFKTLEDRLYDDQRI